MDEVSGRFAKWVFDSGLRDGVGQLELLSGVRVGAEILSKGRDRIDWDDYVQMLENYHGAVGLEGMEESAHSFGTSKEVRSFGRMAGLFFSPRRLYQFMYRWVGNHFLRNVQFRLTPNKDGTLVLETTIDRSTRGSEVYFLTLGNVLAGTPRRIGREPSVVEITSLSEHRAEYLITPPKRTSGLLWTLGWPFRAIASIGSIREIFIRQQEEIRDGQSAIGRQRAEFAAMIERMSDPLFIVGRDGETLFVNRTAKLWFMVPDPPGEWRPESALQENADSSKWDALVSGKVPGEEITFVRRDLGNATVKLAFQTAQGVEFGSEEAMLLIGRDVTVRRKVESQIRDVAFQERANLAKEIHDGLGQLLTAISLNADALANQLEQAGDANAKSAAGIAGVSREAITLVRHLVHGIVASDEEPDNLRRGLSGHADKTRKDFGLEVVLDLPDSPLTLPGQRALEILRIVQEATHNAVKHAGCTEVRISLEVSTGSWRLGVVDNGSGFSAGGASESKGVGIDSMGYRAAQLGGTVEVGDRAGGLSGVEVLLTLPPQGRDRGVEDSAPSVPGDKGFRLVIADDHALVLDGMVSRMGQETDFVVCGQVTSKGEIYPTVKRLAPDVLITDMMMDLNDNLEVIRKVREKFPKLVIVVISMINEEYYEPASIEAGADAYMNKNFDSRELAATIRRAYYVRNGKAGDYEPALSECGEEK